MKKIIVMGLLMLATCCQVFADVRPEVTEGYSTGQLVWSVTQKKITVDYEVTSCGSLSRYVLQNVSDDAFAGDFDWSQMKDTTLARVVLLKECDRLQREMRKRSRGQAIYTAN